MMTRMNGPTAGLAAAAALAFLAGTVHAQYNNSGNNNNPNFLVRKAQLMQLPVVDLKGTVEQVGADGLAIKCEGQAFNLSVDSNLTHVQCNGTADRSYLKPGVLVRFEGEFDKRMQPKSGPLEVLYVVTQSETSQPGIHSDSDVAAAAAAAGENGENSEEGGQRPAKRAAVENCVVIGTIKLLKDDQLQVVADGKPVKVQLAKEAEIKVEVDDYTLAAAGDEIVVRGRTVQPPSGQQPGHVFGEDVTITLAQPLESTSKAPAKKKKSSKTTKSAKR
jgi:hypothetical protein